MIDFVGKNNTPLDFNNLPNLIFAKYGDMTIGVCGDFATQTYNDALLTMGNYCRANGLPTRPESWLISVVNEMQKSDALLLQIELSRLFQCFMRLQAILSTSEYLSHQNTHIS